MRQRLFGILTLGSSIRLGLVAFALAATPATLAWPQASSGMKGIWEPVNYTEDLQLTDVFFVTPEIGYVSGASGTILKTTDAGATWTPLLGGDPASEERPIKQLWFLSPTTGWATQVTSSQTHLFRTTDGELWEVIGTIPEHYEDFAFSSETEGVYVDDKLIFRTQDGGKTWKQVYECKTKAMIGGLTRQVDCRLWKVRFASPTVAYALGGVSGMYAAVVAKSLDGGANWSVVTLLDGNDGYEGGLFFIDENTGYLTTKDAKSAFRTTDGGQKWTGMPATAIPRRILFADPEVGWAMRYKNLSYTTDGGRRWASRAIEFPASPNAFSLPRRDVAYAVGDHGMIYRYRVVPESSPNPAYSVTTVAMPPLANGVIEELNELERGLEGIETAAAGDAGVVPDDDDLGWVESNYSEYDEFEQKLDGIATGLPEIGRKHRNLNIVIEGLRLLGDLTSEGEGLRGTFGSLREAKDVNSVRDALTKLRGQIDAAKTSVAAFQNM